MRSKFAALWIVVANTLAVSSAFVLVSAATAQNFVELNAQERSVLQPLAHDWDGMSAQRKKKWREIAARYPSLSAEEQHRLSTRMHGWSRMSPEDRRQARDQFRELQRQPAATTPEQREQLKRKWAQYRDLPPEHRQVLQRSGGGLSVSPDAESVKRLGAPPLPNTPAAQGAKNASGARVVPAPQAVTR